MDGAQGNEKVGCDPTSPLGLVAIFHGYYYFSSGMSFSIIPESFRDLAQRVTSIDNRYYFAGFNKLHQKNQIFLVWIPQNATHFLTPHH